MSERKTFKQSEIWLTPPAFAKLVPGNPSSVTVRSWAKEGKLPGAFQTPGGRWQIPMSAIDAIAGGGA